MKDLLNPEGVLFQFLSRVGDMIILNVLFLICCVPIVTIGAAQAALYKVTMDMHYDMEGGMFKGFFKAFRENFKQATVVWIVELIVLVSLVCDAMLVLAYFPGSKVMYVLLGILAALVVSVTAYMIPLLVRYRNTLRQHLSNATILAVIKLPKTLVMVFLNSAPFLILMYSLWTASSLFIETLIFWLAIGFSFVAYINMAMMKKVYTQLEGGKNKVSLFT